ncbi:MAG: DNA double-strand break repair nuclease NurA, partial [Anaerolineae bacterium]
MTLELNQLTPQVKAMGQSVAGQSTDRRAALQQAKALLKQHSTELAEREARVTQAEKAQTGGRFNWLGAAPAGEPLAGYHPPPPPPLTNATVIAADGSQIHPDRHAIALYFLVNVGAIVYRHASGTRPDTITEPRLYYKNKDLFLERGLLVPAGVVNVKRDLAEVDMLARLAPAYGDSPGPVIALIDGQLSLRLIDLPARLQTSCQNHYLKTLDRLRQSEALLAAYIDRPRSSFVLSLLHLAGLKPDAITEETLRRNPFVALTDAELFDDLPPGHRTALFNQRAKANIPYARAGHQIH